MKNLLNDDPQGTLLQKSEVTQQLIPPLIQRCRERADVKKKSIIESAVSKMHATLAPEIERLKALKAAGAPVRKEEIQHLQEERQQLEAYFVDAIARLDAIRLIWRGPALEMDRS